jgi:hypothetical protein
MMNAISVGPKWLSGRTSAGSSITDDPGVDDELLDHEVFVTLEDRSGWRFGQRDDLVGKGQLSRLESLGGTGPLLTGGARWPGKSFEGTGRDQRSGCQTLQAGDLIAELLDRLVLLLDEGPKLLHQGGRFGFGDVGQR